MNEFKNLLTYDQKEANVFVCGIPTDRNVILNRGSVNAPHTLRTLSYNLAPTDVGGTFLDKIKVYDCGDYAAEDFNKLTTELQFNFLSKDGFHAKAFWHTINYRLVVVDVDKDNKPIKTIEKKRSKVFLWLLAIVLIFSCSFLFITMPTKIRIDQIGVIFGQMFTPSKWSLKTWH